MPAFFVAYPLDESDSITPQLLCWTGGSSGGDWAALDGEYASALGWQCHGQVLTWLACVPPPVIALDVPG